MKYDLVIVGGGLVGAGLAAALDQSNLRIALVDARLPTQEDPRLFALNASSCQFLTNLSIWQALTKYAEPIHQVHISYQGHFGAVRLQREDVNANTLGYVIPAYLIETALNQRLEELKNITVYRPAKLTALTQQEDVATLKLQIQDAEIILQANLVIGADGTESTVRDLSHINVKRFDYAQSALVTRTSLKRSHQQIAYERFTQEGAIAMLPLINNECATIWTANHEKIQQLMSLSDGDFVATLQAEFGYRVGRLEGVAKRHMFPLKMVKAEKAIEGCVYLIGNAAHTLHPIAAQGFNLALFEVAALVDKIMDNVSRQEAITAISLQEANEHTLLQQSMSMGTSHRLPQLFGNDARGMSILLQLGLVGFDVARPIKKQFIKSMMGRLGKVPHLLLS